MKATKILAMALALQFAPLAVAAAQETTTEADIVVQAPSASDREQVGLYVQSLTTPVGRRIMPRWNNDLCLGLAGMRTEQARAMNDRIGELANSLGIDVQPPGCRPNVLIFFSADANTLAQEIAANGNLVSATGDTGNSRGQEALAEFVADSRAVRWWHVSTSSVDGFEFGRDSREQAPRQNAPTSFDPSAEATPADQARELDQQRGDSVNNGIRVRQMSRVRGAVAENMARVLIVIDATRTTEATIAAVADYVAMITLAQINPDADVSSVPSILNLFAEGDVQRPGQLTSWDRAYLTALYEGTEATNVRQQENQIVRNMMRATQ